MMTDALDGKTILVTGGTGSLGNEIVNQINLTCKPRKVIIYSRNEYNQHLMSQRYEFPWLRYFIGDIRDKDRLAWCFKGVDFVIHAAALKHISVCEYSPLEAIKTNILGSANVVEACLAAKVSRGVLVSTDKVPKPENLYGATKFAAERLFNAANSYGRTCFKIIRYGNVLNSHGSVVEKWLSLKRRGIHEFAITHPECTRFWITLAQAAQEVIKVLLLPEKTPPLYIPRIPSMKITDLARAIDPECTFKIIGLQPGEKIHEELCPGYTSDKNDQWLMAEDVRKMLKIDEISSAVR